MQPVDVEVSPILVDLRVVRREYLFERVNYDDGAGVVIVVRAGNHDFFQALNDRWSGATNYAYAVGDYQDNVFRCDCNLGVFQVRRVRAPLCIVGRSGKDSVNAVESITVLSARQVNAARLR